jgi:hypothetical protein
MMPRVKKKKDQLQNPTIWREREEKKRQIKGNPACMMAHENGHLSRDRAFCRARTTRENYTGTYSTGLPYPISLGDGIWGRGTSTTIMWFSFAARLGHDMIRNPEKKLVEPVRAPVWTPHWAQGL